MPVDYEPSSRVASVFVHGSIPLLRESGKNVIAVDIDEVLAFHVVLINQWHNATYGQSNKLEDYKSYNFCETWACSDSEAMDRCYEFFKTDAFQNLPVVPGAPEALRVLKQFYSLCIVTSRQRALETATLKWLDKHFGLDLFGAVMMGNIWVPVEDAPRLSKAEMCAAIKADAMIDDLPRYIQDVSPLVKTPILFNFNNMYKWSSMAHLGPDAQAKTILCHDWNEVVQVLTKNHRTALLYDQPKNNNINNNNSISVDSKPPHPEDSIDEIENKNIISSKILTDSRREGEDEEEVL